MNLLQAQDKAAVIATAAKITASTFHGFDLKYDELNQRLNAVKKEFGLRRAISTHSLSGETRTFAEILDAQVETIVLYYLEVQGVLAKQLRILRSKQIAALQHPGITLESIEDLCKCYRQIGQEVLELLNYLDRNSVALRKIILRHDVLFDQKMGSLYFDSRLSSQGNSVKNGAQLRQLYRQEGIIAIVASVRRGFEELYDGRKTLLDATEEGFQIGNRQRAESITVENLHYFGSTSHDFHPDDRKCIPRVPFRKRLASFGNLRKLAFEAAKTHIESFQNTAPERHVDVVATEASPLLSRNPSVAHSQATADLKQSAGDSKNMKASNSSNRNPSGKGNRSTGNLFGLLNQSDHQLMTSSLYDGNNNGGHRSENHFFNYQPIKRSLSELEPILKRINEVGQRVIKTQERTTLEFLSDQSEIALEFNIRDMNRAAERSHRRKKKPVISQSHKQDVIILDEYLDDDIKTSNSGLYLNLIVTFLYQANQYIVAPTSSRYANLLGMTAAMSGMIIGFSPAAALISSLAYSKWSNYSFKSPLITCIVCATLGNILYGAALQCNSIPMIFLGRLLVGFGGPRVISRRYIADHVSLQDRLVASGQFVSAGALGLVFGPLLASLMERWNFSYTWKVAGYLILRYESVTAPGWTMSLLWFISLIAVVVWFEDPSIFTADNDSNSNLSAFDNQANVPDGNTRSSIHKAFQKSNKTSHKSSSTSYQSDQRSDVEWGVDVTTIDEEYEDSGPTSSVTSAKTMKVGIAERNAKLEEAAYSPEPFVQVVTHVEMTPYNRPKPPRDESHLHHPVSSIVNGLRNEQHHTAHGNPIHHSLSTGNVPIQKKANTPVTWSDASYEDASRQSQLRAQHFQHQPDASVSAWSCTSCFNWISKVCWCSCFQKWYESCNEQYSYYFDWVQYVTIEIQVILLVYLVNKVGQELVVSSAPLLTKELFHWTNEAVGYYMAIIGALVVPTNILVHSMVKEADERDTLKTLTILSMVGIALVCYLPALGEYTLLQYLLGSALGFTMLNAIEGVVMSLLSKLIAPELAKGTFNSGLLATEAGTMGRVVGDMMITLLADPGLSSTGLVNRLYIPLLLLLIASLALGFRFYDNLLD